MSDLPEPLLLAGHVPVTVGRQNPAALLVANKVLVQELAGTYVHLALGHVCAGVAVGFPVVGHRHFAEEAGLGIDVHAAEPRQEQRMHARTRPVVAGVVPLLGPPALVAAAGTFESAEDADGGMYRAPQSFLDQRSRLISVESDFAKVINSGRGSGGDTVLLAAVLEANTACEMTEDKFAAIRLHTRCVLGPQPHREHVI